MINHQIWGTLFEDKRVNQQKKQKRELKPAKLRLNTAKYEHEMVIERRMTSKPKKGAESRCNFKQQGLRFEMCLAKFTI